MCPSAPHTPCLALRVPREIGLRAEAFVKVVGWPRWRAALFYVFDTGFVRPCFSGVGATSARDVASHERTDNSERCTKHFPYSRTQHGPFKSRGTQFSSSHGFERHSKRPLHGRAGRPRQHIETDAVPVLETRTAAVCQQTNAGRLSKFHRRAVRLHVG